MASRALRQVSAVWTVSQASYPARRALASRPAPAGISVYQAPALRVTSASDGECLNNARGLPAQGADLHRGKIIRRLFVIAGLRGQGGGGFHDHPPAVVGGRAPQARG